MNDREQQIIKSHESNLDNKYGKQPDKKSQELMLEANIKLHSLLKEFYSGITEDNEANEGLYNDYNMQWKQWANFKNRLQKKIKVQPFAFENKIKEYSLKALEDAKANLSQETPPPPPSPED